MNNEDFFRNIFDLGPSNEILVVRDNLNENRRFEELRCNDVANLIQSAGISQSYQIYRDVEITMVNLEEERNSSQAFKVERNSKLLEMSERYKTVLSNSYSLHTSDNNGINNPNRAIIITTSAIWSLVEIIMVNNIWDHYVMYRLRNWMLKYFDLSPDVQPLLNGVKAIHEGDVNYWNQVYALVFQTHFEEAAGLLMLNPNPESRSEEVINLLVKRPQLELHEFDEDSFHNWINRVKDLKMMINEGSKLHDIILILLGEKSVYTKYSELLGSFYVMLICLNLHKSPALMYIEVQQEIRFCMQHYGDINNPMDLIIRGVLELDLKGTICNCSKLLNNPWLMCHLFQLVFYSRGFDITCDDISFNEKITIDYVTHIISYKNLWHIAMKYLDTCPKLGREMQISLLDSVVRQDDQNEKKLRLWCIRLGLNEQYMDICREKAVLLMKKRLYNDAVAYAIKSRDKDFIDYCIDSYLFSEEVEDEFESLKFLDSFVNLNSESNNSEQHFMQTRRIMFIINMRKFFKSTKQKNIKQPIKHIVDIISTTIYPDEYLITLFMYLKPYLRQQTSVSLFSEKQMMILLRKIDSIDENCLTEVQRKDYSQINRMLMASSTSAIYDFNRLSCGDSGEISDQMEAVAIHDLENSSNFLTSANGASTGDASFMEDAGFNHLAFQQPANYYPSPANYVLLKDKPSEETPVKCVQHCPRSAARGRVKQAPPTTPRNKQDYVVNSAHRSTPVRKFQNSMRDFFN